MEALGYAAPLYKTAAFALSGAIAGLAGALYATHAGFVAPSLGGVLFSTEVVVWVAIGGRESLLGRASRRACWCRRSPIISAPSPSNTGSSSWVSCSSS